MNNAVRKFLQDVVQGNTSIYILNALWIKKIFGFMHSDTLHFGTFATSINQNFQRNTHIRHARGWVGGSHRNVTKRDGVGGWIEPNVTSRLQ